MALFSLRFDQKVLSQLAEYDDVMKGLPFSALPRAAPMLSQPLAVLYTEVRWLSKVEFAPRYMNLNTILYFFVSPTTK